MSADQTSNINLVVEELSRISNESQFLDGVQKNPSLLFDVVKELINHSKELNNAVSILRTAQSEISEKNSRLEKAASDLDSAQQKIKKLEKKTSVSSPSGESQIQNALNRFAEVLGNWEPNPPVTLEKNDTNIFDGNKAKFQTWKESILMKLKSSSRQFPTEQSKMNYVYSKMSGDCQAHLHSWISEGELLFPSLQSMFHLLGTLFDDPNRISNAKARLFANQQRNKPFSSWIAEIRRDAAIAGYDRHLGPLRDIIFLNLSLELKKAIIHEKDIDNLDLDNAIARLQDIDSKQRSFVATASKSRFRNSFNPFIGHLENQGNALKAESEDAMDLSSANVRPHGPLKQEEKDRRRKMGLCIYCGRPGHVIKNCPLKPTSTITPARSSLMESTIEEYSGKE